MMDLGTTRCFASGATEGEEGTGEMTNEPEKETKP